MTTLIIILILIIVIIVAFGIGIFIFAHLRIQINEAIAQIRSSDDKIIHGYVHFTPNRVWGELTGLPPGEHGFHIHEKGNSKGCCESLGGHFNPFKNKHGDRCGKVRHMGDLGNIIVDEFGSANFSFDLPQSCRLYLNGDYSILGRSVIIHQDRDDLGLGNHSDSTVTGHSGTRIAYGIIGIEK
jgi:superoxide dismutase, Cu-Zn family